MTTYDDLHAGDVVRGADGGAWGVARVSRAAGALDVDLVQGGGTVRVTGRPAPGLPVERLREADVSAEFAAAGVLIAAFGPIEVTEEKIDL